MKHTRVPRTVRRDIWRLAMETLSIPSLHIFWSRIWNQIKSWIENRKKTNGPNRKSNHLKNKKNPHTLCHIGLLLGLIDAVQCLRKQWTLAFYKQSVTRKFNEPILLFQTERVSFARTLYQHKSALSKPYLVWAAVHCHVPPLKGQEEAVEVHDEVKLSKGEVRPANLILIITYWWQSQLTLDYATLTITE